MIDITIQEKWLQGLPYISLVARIEIKGKKFVSELVCEYDAPIGKTYNDFLSILKQAESKKRNELLMLNINPKSILRLNQEEK